MNEIGEYKGESASLLEVGTHQLKVKADGNWWLEVRQPRITDGDKLPQSLQDTKLRVFGPFEFSGSHTAICSHNGDHNFQVSLLPPEGQFNEFIFNEIGHYTGQTTFQYSGIGYIIVIADSKWSLELK
ncbi:hypothetical protein [Natronococcus wangiae]|uniref:hypothetical protein n=1 Tax=Natronococcus wangiae TaxID=3068275 RepID=UPI00273DE034|nr:hypothetical protein [Natronococcus sp. AD5]